VPQHPPAGEIVNNALGAQRAAHGVRAAGRARGVTYGRPTGRPWPS